MAQPSAAVSTARPSDPSYPFAEHAFTLYTQGHRTTAIAARLGVSPRTVRRWLRKILKDLVLTSREDRIAELLRAIESQRAVIAAAWDSYTRESRREDQLLSGQLDSLPHHYTAGHRYLAVISSAQREVARLQNLYDQTLLTEASEIHITITRRPDGPENVPPDQRPLRFPHLYPPNVPGPAPALDAADPLDDEVDDDPDSDDDDLDESAQRQENPA